MPPSEKPAWRIPLSVEEKIALGELVAIQGQIEHMMRLALDRAAFGDLRVTGGRPELGLVSISDKTLGSGTRKWLTALQERLTRPDLIETAKTLAKRIFEHVEQRNSLLHATYAHISMSPEGYPTGMHFDVPEHAGELYGRPMIVRAKDRTRRPVSDILLVRDEAAKLSRDMRAFKEAVWSTEGAP